MNILFITRATTYTAPGGDTVQIESTAKYLRQLGLSIDIILANEKVNYTNYDIIHFFNITRPADILNHVEKSKKPFVISPIFIDYSEYEKSSGSGLVSVLSRLLPNETVEYIKTVARYIKNGEKINSWSFLWRGQQRSIEYLLKHTSYLLPNSQSEYNRLYNRYHIPQKYIIVPNAIDPEKFSSVIDTSKKEESTLLCVARIEGIKNQLNLIKAVNETKFRLILVGKPAPNHFKYYQSCVAAAGSNIQFVDHVPQEQLIPLYQQAHIHILPSWFETTGLASLEAAAMGCKIVITDKGDTKEYFKDYVYYCDPGNPASIRSAILEAAHNPINLNLRTHVLNNYTWDIAAKQTLKAYNQLLNS
jgi:glycosyltransferase involved in cell wall biosynthesis